MEQSSSDQHVHPKVLFFFKVARVSCFFCDFWISNRNVRLWKIQPVCLEWQKLLICVVRINNFDTSFLFRNGKLLVGRYSYSATEVSSLRCLSNWITLVSWTAIFLVGIKWTKSGLYTEDQIYLPNSNRSFLRLKWLLIGEDFLEFSHKMS